MEKEATITKELADLIVSICFDVNELKKLPLIEPMPNALLFQWAHRDIKHRMDAILGARGMKGMIKEVRKTKDFVKNTITIYEMVPDGLVKNSKVMTLLNKILTEVTELQSLLSLRLKRTP